jgi:hypothetical protein
VREIRIGAAEVPSFLAQFAGNAVTKQVERILGTSFSGAGVLVALEADNGELRLQMVPKPPKDAPRSN